MALDLLLSRHESATNTPTETKMEPSSCAIIEINVSA